MPEGVLRVVFIGVQVLHQGRRLVAQVLRNEILLEFLLLKLLHFIDFGVEVDVFLFMIFGRML